MDSNAVESLADRFGDLPPDRQDASLGSLGLKRGIELSVPHLRLSEKYKTSSTTEVYWEDGFYGKVKFVRWKSFDKLLKETWDGLQKLPRDDYFYLSMDLSRVIKIVKGEHLPHDDYEQKTGGSGVDPRQVKTLSGACEKAQSSSTISHVETNSDVLVPGDLSKSVQSARNDKKQEDPGDVFTDEKSTTGVNSCVFMYALSLVQSLRGDKNLAFRSHGFSSEIITKMHPSVLGLPCVTTVHPDQALVTLKTSHTHKIQPVCTFEFKGPGLDICGFRDTKAHSKKTTAPDEGKTGVPVKSESTELDRQAQDVSIAKRTCLNEEEAQREMVADKVVQFFNGLFPEGFCSLDSEGWNHRKIQRAVSQTLTQGLISQTGNCFLYNFEVGIAFELQGRDFDGKIIVAVSRPFHCDEEQGTVAAIIAQAFHSLNRLEEDTELPFRVRELARVISTATNEFNTRDEGEGEDSRIQDSTGDTTRDRPNKCQRIDGRGDATDHGRQRNVGTVLPNAPSDHVDEPKKTQSIHIAKLLPVASCESSGSTTSGHLVERKNLRDEISEMFQTNEGILGIGRSGSVLLGTWRGHKVAIKSRNCESNNGFHDLCREIDFYKFLQKEFPYLLCYVVPNFFMGSNELTTSRRRTDVVLVTEYVGNEIKRDMKDVLWVSEAGRMMIVSPSAEAAIRLTAERSLEALHEHGILHGDIALRNLRVKIKGGGHDPLEW